MQTSGEDIHAHEEMFNTQYSKIEAKNEKDKIDKQLTETKEKFLKKFQPG